MYAYAIPAFSTILTATHLWPSFQAMRHNSLDLIARTNTLRSYFQEQRDWNVNSLAHVTTLALSLSATPDMDGVTGPAWEKDLEIARNDFNTKLGKISIPKAPNWISKAWMVAIVAQGIVCYKNPLSTFARVASLTATIALPFFCLTIHNLASKAFQDNFKNVSRYVFSNPVMTHNHFRFFVQNGTRYQNTGGTQFTPDDMNDLGRWLSTNKKPTTIIPHQG